MVEPGRGGRVGVSVAVGGGGVVEAVGEGGGVRVTRTNASWSERSLKSVTSVFSDCGPPSSVLSSNSVSFNPSSVRVMIEYSQQSAQFCLTDAGHARKV